MACDVFISYRRKDSEFVAQLYEELTQRGISAWFDKADIDVAAHWRTSISEGIRDCTLFLVVLSPDAVQSVNIRKEVDLAEGHNKKIIPLMWRQTDIPVAFEYALAGIQWIDFQETASQENFDQLADVIKRLLGGESMHEATTDKQIATESKIPAIEKEVAPPDTGQKPGKRRKLSILSKKPTVDPRAIGGLVISNVVTSFDLEIEDQDLVNNELKWLFSAIDNFLKFHRKEIDRSQPVGAPLPETAERSADADNRLLDSLGEYYLGAWKMQIDSDLIRINSHLRNLNTLLNKEAFMGSAGRGDPHLQNQIRDQRINVIRTMQAMARLMHQAYGVLVTSPDQLMEFLSQQ